MLVSRKYRRNYYEGSDRNIPVQIPKESIIQLKIPLCCRKKFFSIIILFKWKYRYATEGSIYSKRNEFFISTNNTEAIIQLKIQKECFYSKEIPNVVIDEAEGCCFFFKIIFN